MAAKISCLFDWTSVLAVTTVRGSSPPPQHEKTSAVKPILHVIDPRNVASLRSWMCDVHIRAGDISTAFACFFENLSSNTFDDNEEDAITKKAVEPTEDFNTWPAKLEHDAALWSHLSSSALIEQAYSKVGLFLQMLYRSIPSEHLSHPNRVINVVFPDKARTLWHLSKHRLTHVQDLFSERVVVENTAVHFERNVVQNGWAIMDNILTPNGFVAVRKLLQLSTIYHQSALQDNALSATLDDGLASPLLLQFVKELTGAIQNILGTMVLQLARAIKFHPRATESVIDVGEYEALPDARANSSMFAVVWFSGQAVGGVKLGEVDTSETSVFATSAPNRLLLWNAAKRHDISVRGNSPDILKRRIDLVLLFGQPEHTFAKHNAAAILRLGLFNPLLGVTKHNECIMDRAKLLAHVPSVLQPYIRNFPKEVHEERTNGFRLQCPSDTLDVPATGVKELHGISKMDTLALYKDRSLAGQCANIGMWGHPRVSPVTRCKYESVSVLFGLVWCKGCRVLDWGAGCGHAMDLLKRKYPHLLVVGCEVVNENVKWAQRNDMINDGFCASDCSSLHFLADRSFDLVLGNAALYHLSFERQCETIRKHVVRILRNGGCAWFGWQGTDDGNPKSKWETCLSVMPGVVYGFSDDSLLFGCAEYNRKDAFSIFICIDVHARAEL